MIAAEFAMDLASVNRHRASLMRKLNAVNVADAVRIAICAGLGDWARSPAQTRSTGGTAVVRGATI